MFCSIQVTGPVLLELLGSWTQLETLHATFVSAPFDVTDLSKLKELKEVKLKASAGSNIQVQNTSRLFLSHNKYFFATCHIFLRA